MPEDPELPRIRLLDVPDVPELPLVPLGVVPVPLGWEVPAAPADPSRGPRHHEVAGREVAAHRAHLDEALGRKAGRHLHVLGRRSGACTCRRASPSAPTERAVTGTVSTLRSVLFTAIVSFTDAPTSWAGAVVGVIER